MTAPGFTVVLLAGALVMTNLPRTDPPAGAQPDRDASAQLQWLLAVHPAGYARFRDVSVDAGKGCKEAPARRRAGEVRH